jgi:hypothetical protein
MKKTTYKTKDKDFDAVKMMRSIRDNLSKRWVKHPGVMKKDLEKTREEYSRYFKK